jgi:hypothetical protein
MASLVKFSGTSPPPPATPNAVDKIRHGAARDAPHALRHPRRNLNHRDADRLERPPHPRGLKRHEERRVCGEWDSCRRAGSDRHARAADGWGGGAAGEGGRAGASSEDEISVRGVVSDGGEVEVAA